MTLPSFEYRFTTFLGQSVLLIEDLDWPNRPSVTNKIEEVIESIASGQKINPVEHMIIYRDSEGKWDGFDFSTKQFRVFRAKTALGAMKQYHEHQKSE